MQNQGNSDYDATSRSQNDSSNNMWIDSVRANSDSGNSSYRAYLSQGILDLGDLRINSSSSSLSYIPQPSNVRYDSGFNFEIGDLSRKSSYQSEIDRSFLYQNQMLQDFWNNELRAQVNQFKRDMIITLNDSTKEYREKIYRNQEMINAIKENIRNNRQNLQALDRKIEEYHMNLDAINTLIHSEIEYIKKNLPDTRYMSSEEKKRLEDNIKRYNDKKLKAVEFHRLSINKTYEMLKNDLDLAVNSALQQFDDSYLNMEDDKASKFIQEITSNMEQKINKVLDHLNGKVAVLEKQVQNYNRYDDPIVEKIKFEIEENVSGHVKYEKEQIALIQKLTNNTVDQSNIHNLVYSQDVDLKIAHSQKEFESINYELAVNSDFLNQEKRDIEEKMSLLESEISENLRNIRFSFPSDTNQDQALPMDARVAEFYETRIHELESNFKVLKQNREFLDNLFKHKKIDAEFMSPVSNQSSSTADEFNALEKLDNILDQLSDNVEALGIGAGMEDAFFYKIAESKANYVQNYREPPLSLIPERKSSEKQRSFISQGNESGLAEFPVQILSAESSPEKSMSKDLYRSGSSSSRHGNSNVKKSFEAYSNVDNAKVEEHRLDNILQNQVEEFAIKKTYSNKDLIADQIVEKIKNSPKRNRGSPMRDMHGRDSEQNGLDESVEVEYQIDENRFLMDEDGNYILDENGERVQLSEEKVEELRNLLGE